MILHFKCNWFWTTIIIFVSNFENDKLEDILQYNVINFIGSVLKKIIIKIKISTNSHTT